MGKVIGIEFVILDDNGVILKFDEIGEVCIKGFNVILGYWNNFDVNKVVFVFDWFYIGDCGKLDVEGYFILMGCIKELINCGGVYSEIIVMNLFLIWKVVWVVSIFYVKLCCFRMRIYLMVWD